MSLEDYPAFEVASKRGSGRRGDFCRATPQAMRRLVDQGRQKTRCMLIENSGQTKSMPAFVSKAHASFLIVSPVSVRLGSPAAKGSSTDILEILEAQSRWKSVQCAALQDAGGRVCRCAHVLDVRR